MPVLATQACELGMVDKVLPEDWNQYHDLFYSECEMLADDDNYFPALARKQYSRLHDENIKPLESYRQYELQRMKAIFDNPQSEYHQLRYNFVYKISCAQTPARLVYRAPERKVAHIA
jgi:putative two-component system hydrogenase maturation factor HypX/HoxX